MLSYKVVLSALGLICLSGCAWAGSYGVAPVPAYQAVYSAPEYSSPDAAEAAASAITDIAAAKASAAKLGPNVNWAALNHYGYQIGVPLLVRNYGPLTSLYSALAPKRSFVGTVDAGFHKDSYGNVKFSDEYAVGAIAI
ncbi:chorion protein S16 [Calliphora vicina]|uniref:chorion protein S16 n=1 Tax=Calliphora vicina TaxID=7373 RepID=UPI00325BE308